MTVVNPNEFVTVTNAAAIKPRHITSKMLRLSLSAFKRHSDDVRIGYRMLCKAGFIIAVEEAVQTLENYEHNGTKEFVTGLVFGVFGGVGIVAVVTAAMQWLHVGRWP